MDKKKLMTIGLITLFCFIILIPSIYCLYNYFRVKNAKIFVELVDNREVEVFEKKYISDFIKSINGKLEKDNLISTNKLGEKEITFSYVNDDKIKVNYSFKIKVVDKTKPLIVVPSTYAVTEGYNKDLSKEFFCGDNYDDEPICKIEGEYNTDKIGTYNLKYIAQDKSKNISTQKFILKVKKKEKNKPSKQETKYIDFNDIVKEHKKNNTKIGIDVSHWQGNIDFKKVKNAGVEFAFIRVGTENSEGELYLDKKFENNIKGFNKEKIPVGIYYYSYADSVEKAKKEAKWVVKQIKKYKIDLPVVFDWENWSNYREFNLSFYSLTKVANAFLKEVEKAGYEGMLYSSKYYLENIWHKTKYKTWLAHYTAKTNYEGDYYIWQLCSNGKVEGIPDNTVDLNIMYKK